MAKGELPASVLFACTQNAVRSPMAEALAKRLYGMRAYFDSAGVQDCVKVTSPCWLNHATGRWRVGDPFENSRTSPNCWPVPLDVTVIRNVLEPFFGMVPEAGVILMLDPAGAVVRARNDTDGLHRHPARRAVLGSP